MKECYPTPDRSTQISNEIQKLANIVDEIEMQGVELENRLNDIVIGEPPQIAGKDSEPCEDALVPLAERIRSLRQRLERVNRNTNNLMQRIEL
jgi:chaperonin cofactor prefoldin